MAAYWYQNETWSPAIAKRFEDKLSRARDKTQYLNIQAHMLAKKHPELALQLIERLLSFPEDSFFSSAYVTRAQILARQGRTAEAAASYETALQFESKFPNMLTQAWLELPFLIATKFLKDKFSRACKLLKKRQFEMLFPIEHFLWHASHALILDARGKAALASEHARKALEAAAQKDSGLRYHPSMGLVGKEYEGLRKKLRRIGKA